MKKIIHQNLVIGSGISSTAVVISLLNNKKKVTLVSPNKNFNHISNSNDVLFCEEGLPLPNTKIKKWRRLNHLKLMQENFFGGHSNFWGANSLRFTRNSFKDWPVNYEEITKYYKIAEYYMNVSQYDDDLSRLFKIKIKKNLSQKKLIKKLIKKKSNLHLGISRIAINKKKKQSIEHKDIFKCKYLLEDLIKKKKISYFDNEVILIKKKKGLFTVQLKNKKKIFSKKIYLGAGIFNTSKIIKKSVKIKKKKLFKLKQAQGFLVPAIYLGENIKNFFLSSSLSSFHLLKENYDRKNNDIYMELKFMKKLVLETLKKKIGLFAYLIPEFIYKRVIILWGFIPSQNSFNYYVKNKKIIINSYNKILKKKNEFTLNKFFSEINNSLNIFIIKKLIKFTQFARGYHIGSSIPMSNKNKNDKYLTVNNYGELKHQNFKNLYIVDTSVFPNIPSGSIGLTLFANAYRIANLSSKKND